MTANHTRILPENLDLLILKKTGAPGPPRGYGILPRIEQISGKTFLIKQGTLYPAWFRLVSQGFLRETWATFDNHRHAKFYELSMAGCKCLRETKWMESAGAASENLEPTRLTRAEAERWARVEFDGVERFKQKRLGTM